MESDFITKYNFGSKKFVIFMFWKNITAKFVANICVLGYYMLQQLVPQLKY